MKQKKKKKKKKRMKTDYEQKRSIYTRIYIFIIFFVRVSLDLNAYTAVRLKQLHKRRQPDTVFQSTHAHIEYAHTHMQTP